MPLTGDMVADKKLVRVKRMYQHAVDLATRHPDSMARLRTVLELDWVIEAMLKTLLGALNPGKSPSERLNELLQDADTVLQRLGKPLVADRGHLVHVRALRNAAQHEARDPTDIELSECHIYTRDFLIATLYNTWGLTLDQVSLVALVQTPCLAQILQDADNALDTQDWLTATELAMLSLELADEMSHSRLQDHSRQNRAFRQLSTFGNETTSHDVQETLEGIQQVLRFLVLGMDYSSHVDFLRTAGSIGITVYAKFYSYHAPATGITEASARTTAAYVTDIVLQMEQRLGDLDPKHYWPRPARYTPSAPPAPLPLPAPPKS